MAKSYRYLWIDPIIISYTGIMSCVSVLGSVFDGTGRWQHGCARHWARFILRISKARVTVNGLENVPLDRPCLFASTHQSFFDIWVLLAHLPIQFRFAAKESLFRVPFLGWHLRRSGNIPIHRGDPRKALRSIRDAARRIAAGVPVLVFPEGERSPDGTLQPFKNGLFLLATYAGCPVVPITIQDSRHRLPKHSMRIQPGPLTMTVLPPVEVTGFDARNIAELSDRVRSAMLTVYPDGTPTA